MSGHLGDTHDLPRQDMGITHSYFFREKRPEGAGKACFLRTFQHAESKSGRWDNFLVWLLIMSVILAEPAALIGGLGLRSHVRLWREIHELSESSESN